MARVLVVGGLAALAFAIFSVVDCALTERSAVRGLPRWLWIVLILVLPVVGGVLWFLIGHGRAASRPSVRPTGPDDDPEFLRRTSGRRPAAPSSGEPDWRRLEQELADRDDDGENHRR